MDARASYHDGDHSVIVCPGERIRPDHSRGTFREKRTSRQVMLPKRFDHFRKKEPLVHLRRPTLNAKRTKMHELWKTERKEDHVSMV